MPTTPSSSTPNSGSSRRTKCLSSIEVCLVYSVFSIRATGRPDGPDRLNGPNRQETMKVSGFTFVRNVVKYDYPVVESIRSILPVVDEFIVNVGRCDDGTLELIRSIGDPKIK